MRSCLFSALSLAPLLIVLASACGGETLAGGTSTSTVDAIGAAGGIVTSSDGEVTLTIPKGALSANVKVTISPIQSPGGSPSGQVYDLEPTGTTFAAPATLAFGLQGVSVAIGQLTSLRVATYSGGAWQSIVSDVDVSTATVSAPISHFSPWALVLGAAASGGTCAQGAACSDNEGCGGGSTGSGGGSSFSCGCVDGAFQCTTSTTTPTEDAGDDSGYGECAQGAACPMSDPNVSSGCGTASTDGGVSYSCMCVNGTYECSAGG